MKIAFYTKYSRMGASSRLRSYQYIPLLEQQGHTVDVFPLFGDSYLTALYANKSVYVLLLKAYIKRWFLLFTVFKYDILFVEYEFFPYLPPVFEYILSWFGVRYVVDYDDAIFHNYDMSSNALVRGVLGKKIDTVMRKSAYVIAGNSYLAERAARAKAKQIQQIPTVIDVTRYDVKKNYNNTLVTIGWIGSPSTFKYLALLKPVFLELAKTHTFQIKTVGAGDKIAVGVPEQMLSWQEVTEVDNILSFDIGVMPLEDSPWAKGKCSYKLIQYMGCGIPVIASAVGMNTTVVAHELDGFLATSEATWLEALKKLIENNTLRSTMGTNGRAKVEHEYNLTKSSILLQQVFKTATTSNK